MDMRTIYLHNNKKECDNCPVCQAFGFAERKEDMNAKKAKKLRKKIYGKDATRDRDYKINQRTGQLVDVGKRAEYQQAKKEK